MSSARLGAAVLQAQERSCDAFSISCGGFCGGGQSKYRPRFLVIDRAVSVRTQRAADCSEYLNNRTPVQLFSAAADTESNRLRPELQKDLSQFLGLL